MSATRSRSAEQILAKLKTSGLSPEDAAKLKVKLADPAELKALGFPAKLAVEIPYFTITGKINGFKRWRFLEDTRSGFDAATQGSKSLRYVQAPGTPPEIYLPPFADWRAIQNDASTSIVITEGEFKAACCSRHCAPCLGLGGVYSFKSVKRRQALLPALQDFKWEGRTVVVAYDSDARTNPMVVAARNELCTILLSFGAEPLVADVTAAEDGSKRGLDDILVQEGEEALLKLLQDAEPFSASAALHELNTEVVYIRDPGIVVVQATNQKMRPSDFVGHAYANRHYWEPSITANGAERLVKRKAAQAWLEWPLRMELRTLAYEPGQPQVTEDNRLNTWMGWGVEPKKGSVKPWKDLLDYLFINKPFERSYFERWCAYPFQHPGVKMYTAAVLWGVNTGTGKSLVGYTLGRLYGRNFTEIGDCELQGDFNEWAVDKQFIMGDDVTGHDQRKYSGKLKKMITQLEMRIERKYIPAYTVRDVINYLFTSNHPDAFFLEDDDRRNFVHEVQGSPLPVEFYRSYMAWLNSGGASFLFDHLLHLDLGGMRAEDRAPDTEARRSMIDDGLSDLGRWVRRLRDDPVSCLKLGDAKLNGDLWSANELIKLYDPDGRSRATAGGIARELKRAGFRQVYGGMQVGTCRGPQRLFAIRNSSKWLIAAGPELAVHYDATRGGLPVERAKKKF